MISCLQNFNDQLGPDRPKYKIHKQGGCPPPRFGSFRSVNYEDGRCPYVKFLTKSTFRYLSIPPGFHSNACALINLPATCELRMCSHMKVTNYEYTSVPVGSTCAPVHFVVAPDRNLLPIRAVGSSLVHSGVYSNGQTHAIPLANYEFNRCRRSEVNFKCILVSFGATPYLLNCWVLAPTKFERFRWSVSLSLVASAR
jgi:hypothetical protein